MPVSVGLVLWGAQSQAVTRNAVRVIQGVSQRERVPRDRVPTSGLQILVAQPEPNSGLIIRGLLLNSDIARASSGWPVDTSGGRDGEGLQGSVRHKFLDLAFLGF